MYVYIIGLQTNFTVTLLHQSDVLYAYKSFNNNTKKVEAIKFHKL